MIICGFFADDYSHRFFSKYVHLPSLNRDSYQSPTNHDLSLGRKRRITPYCSNYYYRRTYTRFACLPCPGILNNHIPLATVSSFRLNANLTLGICSIFGTSTYMPLPISRGDCLGLCAYWHCPVAPLLIDVRARALFSTVVLSCWSTLLPLANYPSFSHMRYTSVDNLTFSYLFLMLHPPRISWDSINNSPK